MGTHTVMVLGAISYRTFPVLHIAGLEIETFSAAVGLGVVVGAMVAARHATRRAAVDSWTVYEVAALVSIAGFAGARASWVLSNWDEIGSLVDVVAVWRGGMQFSGGFVAGTLAGAIAMRSMARRDRWVVVDGLGLGLCIGLAFGRVGCYAVGEHLGRPSTFWLAVRYDGGPTREPSLGEGLIYHGVVFHHPALYEFLLLAGLMGALLLIRPRATTGTVIAVYCIVYGTGRFALDFLRVNDRRLAGLTGAQYLMIAIVAAGLWVWISVRKSLRLADDGQPVDVAAASV